MMKSKNKLFAILMGSILATGLQAMAPEAQPKRPFFAGILTLDSSDRIRQNSAIIQMQALQEKRRQEEEARRLEKEAVERLKQEKIAIYHKESMGLRDEIFAKYKQGTLPSGVELAKVDSITVEVLDPDMPKPDMPKPEMPSKILISSNSDLKKLEEKLEEDYKKYLDQYTLWLRAQPLKEANGLTCRYEGKDASPVISLSTQNIDIEKYHPAYRRQFMFHEMAHALDGCSRKPEDEKSDCYAWLHGDIKNHRDREKIALGEWHAEKQSTEWMKELNPDDAKALRRELERYIVYGMERPGVPMYPPLAKLVEWLSVNKNPLRMKEIKKLGLLWNM